MTSSLRLGTAWMVFGQGAYAACQWAAIVILARLGGAGEVGAYALAFAVTAPIMIFGHLQMRQVLVTDATERYSFADYATVRSITTLLALLAIVLAAWLGSYGRTTVAVIVIVGVAKAFESFSDLLYGLEQRRGRFDLVGRSLALRGLAGLAAFATAYLLTRSLVNAAAALALAWAIMLALFDHRLTRGWRQAQRTAASFRSWDVRAGVWLQLARFGLPLGVTVMLVSLNTNIPRYFVQAHTGSEGLGIFAALGHFLVAGNLVVTAIGHTVSARLADRFAAQQLVAFRRLLGKLLLLSSLIGLGGVAGAFLLGQPILRVLYGAEFAARADILIWMMLIGLISYPTSALGYGLTAMRQFRWQPVFLLTGVAVNMTGCYLLVPDYGLVGAVVSWLVALTCQAVCYAVAIGRSLRSRPATTGHVVSAATLPTGSERDRDG
jgi:O-antigen/teichoic acid export membrane protein